MLVKNAACPYLHVQRACVNLRSWKNNFKAISIAGGVNALFVFPEIGGYFNAYTITR